MNAIVKSGSQDNMINVLRNSLYPGAKPESVELVLAWCRATGRDPMKKPVHIVPMYVKDAVTGRGEYRDVLMPGVGTYRTDAANTGQYAGKDEPEFGPEITSNIDGMTVTYPQWCRVTVKRIVDGEARNFVAKEFWLENYASGKEKKGVNDMWRKRPYGQLAKCAESQALRAAFPDETGNTNTMEEMEGKGDVDVINVPPSSIRETTPPVQKSTADYLSDSLQDEPPPGPHIVAKIKKSLAKATERKHVDKVDAFWSDTMASARDIGSPPPALIVATVADMIAAAYARYPETQAADDMAAGLDEPGGEGAP